MGVWVVAPELHLLSADIVLSSDIFQILDPTSCGLSLWLWDIEGGRLQEHMDLIPALGAVQFTVLTVLSIESAHRA